MSDSENILIGITSYPMNDEGQYVVPGEYVNGLRQAGAAVVVIPPVPELDVGAILPTLDALVFSGGGDIEPSRYDGNAHETVYNLYPVRDDAEFAIARWVLRERLPTLAICRGLQVLNVVCGGSLHVHIPDVYGESVTHRVPPRNPVLHEHLIEPNSRLAAILKETTVDAHSWHHQSVDRLGDGFRIAARAPDGCIEAIENPDRPELISVQWHPELGTKDFAAQRRLFAELVELARSRKSGSR